MANADRVEAVRLSERTDRSNPDVTLEEFFDPEFVREHTRFDAIGAFWGASPWDVEGREDVGGLPRAELDRYVRRNTRFDSWLAMRNRAAEREIHERLLV